MGSVTSRALRAHGPLPRMSGWTSVGLAIVAGVMMAFAFPGHDIWLLVLPATWMLVAAIDRTSAGWATLAGLAYGLAFFLPHISWATVATGTVLPWVALSVVEALFFAAWALSVSLVRVWSPVHSPAGQAIAYAILWVAMEELRSRVPFGGFAWGKLAYGWVDMPLAHLAPLGGEVLVGGLAMALSVLIRRTFSLHPAHTSPRFWGRPSLLVVSTALMFLPLGITLPNAAENGNVAVGVVQGNIDPPVNATFAEHLKVTQAHADEAERLAQDHPDLDLVIWGENSLGEDPRRDAAAAKLVSDAVNRQDAPTLVGFVDYLPDDTRLNYVGMWYPDKGLDTETLYAKQHPVPFGEYIPMRSFIEKLATEAAQVNVDMIPGTKPAYMQVTLKDGRTIGLATGICFEVAYEQIIAEGVRDGGQLIVIPTNNYTFGSSGESEQQIQMLRFRAMEFGRSGIQASTTGVSAIVRPDGGVLQESELLVPAHINGQVPLRTTITPAAELGSLPAQVTMALAALLLLIGVIGNIAVAIDERRGAKQAEAAKRARAAARSKRSQVSTAPRSANGTTNRAATNRAGGNRTTANRTAANRTTTGRNPTPRTTQGSTTTRGRGRT